MGNVTDDVSPEVDKKLFYSYLYRIKDYHGDFKEEFANAWKHIDELEFVEALKEFEVLAEKGEVFSQTNTAGIYESYPPLKNMDKCIYWYEKAIEKNCNKARAYLGLYYLHDENYDEAYKLLSVSAANKNVDACANLSILYAQGIYVEKNLDKAIQLMTYAAENGLKDHFEPGINYFVLGELYMEIDNEEKGKEAFKIAGKRQPSLALSKFREFFERAGVSWISDYERSVNAGFSEATSFYDEWKDFWKEIALEENSELVDEIEEEVRSYIERAEIAIDSYR